VYAGLAQPTETTGESILWSTRDLWACAAAVAARTAFAVWDLASAISGLVRASMRCLRRQVLCARFLPSVSVGLLGNRLNSTSVTTAEIGLES
jgi:hypothetical protein